MMSAAIIVASVHHGNTQQIAKSMAACLSAKLMTPQETLARDVSGYDLVRIGSGIYFGQHHSSVRRLVQSWHRPPKAVFLFSTAGLPCFRFIQHASLRSILKRKGCEIVGKFAVAVGTRLDRYGCLAGSIANTPTSEILNERANLPPRSN